MSQSDSQHSFLDEVGSWSKDTCRTRLKDALPKLISGYCNGGSADIKIAALRVMVASFLPCLDLQNHSAEDLIFANVLPQTGELFDDMLISISRTASEVSSQEDGFHLKERLQKLLQITLDIIECLGSCLSHVIDTVSGGTLSIDSVQSLPTSVLHIVKGSFHHCKDSNTIYGDHFPLVSETLSSLFKKTYGLQKSLTVMLDAVKLTSDDGDECVEAVAQVCSGFRELCVIIGNMDSTLLVSTWRFLVKTACRHKEQLKNVLQIHPIISTLCSDIEAHYEQCLSLAPHPPSTQSSQGGDERTFAKTLKICSLCIKMLLHVVKEFDGYLGPCHRHLYKLLLVLQSLAPPSIHAPSLFSGPRDEIDRVLLVGVEPLLLQLIDDRSFCDAVTATKQDIPSNLQFGRLLTLVKVLKMLPSSKEETQTAWMDSTTSTWEEPRGSILHAVFASYQYCYVEVALPVNMTILPGLGQPLQDVSLREYVTVYLCGFLASVKARQFGIVERCLLENVISSRLDTAIMAMDVWCFLARYGTASLCASHVHLVADLMTSIPANHSPGYIHLSMLLWRLVPLMAQEHQNELPAKFPPKDHPSLWSHLPLPAIQEDIRRGVVKDLVTHSLEQCQAWLDSKEHTFHSLESLEAALSCISNVYRQFENSILPVDTKFIQRVRELTVGLWEALPLDRIKSHDIVSTLINITGLILTEVTPVDLAKVIKCLCNLLENASLKLRLDVVKLLHRFRKVKVQPCAQLNDILVGLGGLFSRVLADSNCVIRQLAMEAFSTFAEETAHESVVPECLHEESTQTRVVKFLNRIPQECDLTSASKSEVDLLQLQAHTLLRQAAENAAKEDRHLVVLEGGGHPEKSQTGAGHQTGQARDDVDDMDDEDDVDDGADVDDGEASARVGVDEDQENHPAAKRAKHRHGEEGYRQAIAAIHSNLNTIKELTDGEQESLPIWLEAELQSLRDRIVAFIPDP